MPNERNVQALKAVLHEALETTSYDTPVFVEFLARELATYGVLVPSELTDEEVSSAWFTANFEECRTDEEPEMAARVRAALEHIAKGEEVPA